MFSAILLFNYSLKNDRQTCNGYGDRCFVAADPRLWNNLSAHPRQNDINFEQFRLLLTKQQPL